MLIRAYQSAGPVFARSDRSSSQGRFTSQPRTEPAVGDLGPDRCRFAWNATADRVGRLVKRPAAHTRSKVPACRSRATRGMGRGHVGGAPLEGVVSRDIVIGVLTSHDDRGRAEKLAEGLPRSLSDRVDSRPDWRAEVCETEPADVSAKPSELTESVRRRLLDRGWQMGVGLTALPLRVGRRPVATTASATHGVGLVSIPALGAVRVDERLHDAAVDLVSGLLGEGAGDGS